LNPPRKLQAVVVIDGSRSGTANIGLGAALLGLTGHRRVGFVCMIQRRGGCGTVKPAKQGVKLT
jgi:hypothetical protein